MVDLLSAGTAPLCKLKAPATTRFLAFRRKFLPGRRDPDVASRVVIEKHADR
jgi:hypothetical protein